MKFDIAPRSSRITGTLPKTPDIPSFDSSLPIYEGIELRETRADSLSFDDSECSPRFSSRISPDLIRGFLAAHRELTLDAEKLLVTAVGGRELADPNVYYSSLARRWDRYMILEVLTRAAEAPHRLSVIELASGTFWGTNRNESAPVVARALARCLSGKIDILATDLNRGMHCIFVEPGGEVNSVPLRNHRGLPYSARHTTPEGAPTLSAINLYEVEKISPAAVQEIHQYCVALRKKIPFEVYLRPSVDTEMEAKLGLTVRSGVDVFALGDSFQDSSADIVIGRHLERLTEDGESAFLSKGLNRLLKRDGYSQVSVDECKSLGHFTGRRLGELKHNSADRLCWNMVLEEWTREQLLQDLRGPENCQRYALHLLRSIGTAGQCALPLMNNWPTTSRHEEMAKEVYQRVSYLMMCSNFSI